MDRFTTFLNKAKQADLGDKQVFSFIVREGSHSLECQSGMRPNFSGLLQELSVAGKTAIRPLLWSLVTQ